MSAPPTTYLMHFACFRCRRSFKRSVQVGSKDYVRRCPHCGGRAIDLGRHFKPPKADDLGQWKKVRLLVAAGFFFQHVYDEESSQVPYPDTLEEAREFVLRYRSRAWTERMPETLEILAEG
jgi:DNA-directed RNA polymerase subunit RPC12/RpoP